MKSIVYRDGYDVMLEPSDWRYSAAICGLANYLDFWNKDYYVGEDYILYKGSDIDEKHYLEYAKI